MPPECKPELGQLSDRGREEKDRAQSLCRPPAKPLATDLVDIVSYSGSYLKYKAKSNTLNLPCFYMTLDGGDNYTSHVYSAALPALDLRMQLLTPHSTQFPTDI